ncbi:flagellar basal body-associated FliL family protein [Solidesulfovibrio magneticus]|uniref:Flagellar protein FliL n=1 Tax=Solidesulfovibrio magneticus (strain ATCC 700980 / DSM 13731 / RS-1) TaxID=573370 RepID=C4XKE5_SOLM1|nr:flagellar basal body-associated FliL family protein [Solidesulfovibrio magneticus]BAH76885.1 putative flagellar FliL protein [Solidesulfovibrio magneticus RS-1]
MRRAVVSLLAVVWLTGWGLVGQALGQGEPVVRGGTVTYPSFDVNIDDNGGLGRLRLGFEVLFTDELGAKAAATLQVRESILLFLRGKSAAELLAPKGRDMLRAQLLAHINAAIGSPKAVKLFYLDYVVIKGTP